MSFLIILTIALALAMDVFAVSVGLSVGLGRMTDKQAFRLAFHFGLFQFVMPVAGWAAGGTFVRFIEDYDHWIAFGLLLFVGGKMIVESFRPEDRKKQINRDPTQGLSLFVLSLATSIDALAIGLGFAALHVKILYPAAVIGAVAFLITFAGAKVGPFFGRLVGKRAELAGGIILILIGLKILLEHV